jgi:hypothetical protein
MSHLASPLALNLGGDPPPPLTALEMEAAALYSALWPPGLFELYSMDVAGAAQQGDVGKFHEAMGRVLAAFGTGQVADLRVELDPSRCVEKLPDWEAALALPASRFAPTTTAARQAAVVGKLREFGSYTIPNVRGIAGPLLGYADPTTLVVVETNRAALRTAHTYTDGQAVSVGASTTKSYVASVPDDGVVSSAGVQVSLVHLTYSGTAVTVTLTGPDGAATSWAVVAGISTSIHEDNPLVLRSLAQAGKAVNGLWVLSVANTDGTFQADSWGLFVEGIKLDSSGNDGLGAGQFYWAAYADPAKEGVATPSDRAAAREALRRVRPAHTRSAVVTTLAPKPGSLIPSEFVPNS